MNKDPTRKLISELWTMLTRWKNSNFIEHSKYKCLYSSDGLLPRAYGLPKIHKPGCSEL